MITFRRSVWVIIIWLVLPLANHVQATPISCNVTGITPYSPSVNGISFARDAPVGSSSPAYSTSLSFQCEGDPCCDRDIFTALAATPSTLVAGFNDVYPTNVSGIGVRFTVSNIPGGTCSNLPVTIKNGSTTVTCHQLVAAATPGYNRTLNIAATFIKTGPITSGALTTMPSLSVTNSKNNQAGTSSWGNTFTGTASGSFTSIACSVSNSAVKVTMPQVNTRNLPTVGATAGATPFNLSLNCDAGVVVAITLSDVTAPANRGTTLTPTADSTAAGVAYQIAYNGTPVAYGADSAAAGNANQIVVSATPTTMGPLSVPMSASYIRTGSIVPGSVNAKATFTMSYQ